MTTQQSKLGLSWIAVFFIGMLVLIGLGIMISQLKPSPTSDKIRVVNSFYPIYFLTSQIAGKNAMVTNITPAGAEPHDYEPSSGDIAAIEQANLLVLNGGHLEPWADKIKANLQGKPITIISAGDSLATRQLTEDGKTDQDPHVWLDPVLAKQEAVNIADSLIKVDPQNTVSYQSNAKMLESKLDQLDTDYRAGLKNCQEKNIVTSHAAFGYLAAEYGLNQVEIAGLSPDEEPSAEKLAEVSQFVKQNHVSIIFFESLVSPKLSQTIAQETGAKTLPLNPIEGLTEDEMKAGQNYFSLMHDNLTNLRLALQCS